MRETQIDQVARLQSQSWHAAVVAIDKEDAPHALALRVKMVIIARSNG